MNLRVYDGGLVFRKVIIGTKVYYYNKHRNKFVSEKKSRGWMRFCINRRVAHRNRCSRKRRDNLSMPGKAGCSSRHERGNLLLWMIGEVASLHHDNTQHVVLIRAPFLTRFISSIPLNMGYD